jgi:hypothetical protein
MDGFCWTLTAIGEPMLAWCGECGRRRPSIRSCTPPVCFLNSASIYLFGVTGEGWIRCALDRGQISLAAICPMLHTQAVCPSLVVSVGLFHKFDLEIIWNQSRSEDGVLSEFSNSSPHHGMQRFPWLRLLNSFQAGNNQSNHFHQNKNQSNYPEAKLPNDRDEEDKSNGAETDVPPERRHFT